MFNTKTLEAVSNEKSSIHDEEGSPVMNPHTMDEWLQRISNSVDEAQRQSLWGVKSEAIAEMVHALALGMMCLEQHMEADNSNYTNYVKEAVNGHSKVSAISDELDQLGTKELRIIALYEMYASLEAKFMQPFTDRFIKSLNDEEEKLIDQYCGAKIAVLGDNNTLSVLPKKKAGAEA